MQEGWDSMTQQALTIRQDQTLSTTDIMADFGKSLRLDTANGDASPETIRSYYGNAAQFVVWCGEHGIHPATVTEDDIATYGRELVAQYEDGSCVLAKNGEGIHPFPVRLPSASKPPQHSPK
jgi:hypothetical protein